MQLGSPVHETCPGDARHVVAEHLSQPLGVTAGLDSDHRVGADALLERGRGVQGQDAALVHDGDPLAELVGLFHVVGRQQDGLALTVQLAQQVPERETALRVEPGRRLIEEEHGRAVKDGPRHHEPLRHSAGQGVHRRLGPFGQLELLEQLIGGPAGHLRPHAEQPAVKVQVLPDGELPVQGVLLGDDPAQLLGQRRVRRDVHPGEERPSGGRHDPRGQHPRGGGLPRPVRSQQAEDLAGLDVKIQPVDRGEVRTRVDLREVLGMDDRAGRGVTLISSARWRFGHAHWDTS